MSTPNEVKDLKCMVKNLRVHELQEILLAGRLSRIGRKKELIDRIESYLDSHINARDSTRACIIEKVRSAYGRRFGAGALLPSAQSIHPPGVTGVPGFQLHHEQHNGRGGSAQVTPPPADPSPTQRAANVFYNGMPGPRGYPSYSAHSGARGQMPTSAQFRLAMPAATAPNAGKPTIRVDNVSEVKQVNLPFFDPQVTLLKLEELQLRSSHRTQCNEFVFRIPAGHAIDIARSARGDHYKEPLALPRLEVQLRMFQLGVVDHNEQHTDEYPPNMVLKINEKEHDRLPPVIPSNKPGAEPRRYSRPVDLTARLHPVVAERAYKVGITWPADQRRWAITVRVVKRNNSDILLSRLLRTQATSVEVVKAEIIKRVGAGDDDVGTSNIRVCIKDPMSMLRITHPVKGIRCCHLNCFDARSFLEMNEKRPTWRCPDCQKPTSLEDLRIDGYFVSVLKTAGSGVTHVDLCADGSWREVADDSDEDSDDDAPAKPKPTPTSTPQSKVSKPVPRSHLPTDSEAQPQPPPVANVAPQPALPSVSSAPVLAIPTQAAASSTSAIAADVEVIDLSDDDDEDVDEQVRLERDVAAAIEQSKKDNTLASQKTEGRCTPPIACQTDDTVIMLGDSDEEEYDSDQGSSSTATLGKRPAANGAVSASAAASTNSAAFVPPPRKKMNIALGSGPPAQQHAIQDQIRPTVSVATSSAFQIEQTNPLTSSNQWSGLSTWQAAPRSQMSAATSAWTPGTQQAEAIAALARTMAGSSGAQSTHMYGQLNPAQGPGAGAGRAYYSARDNFSELRDQFNQFAAGGAARQHNR